MMRQWGYKSGAGLVMLGLASASCAAILGIDKDYHAFVDESGGGGGGTGPGADACLDVPAEIFAKRCGDSGCHSAANPAQGLDLISPGLVERVVGKSASQNCMGATLADAKAPDDSLLYAKLLNKPPCGAQMPLVGEKLSAAEIDCVKRWIAQFSCLDSVQDHEETDVDCGGSSCEPCADGKGCAVGSDCTSQICTNQICHVPICTDGVRNGTETDIDCGGTSCVPCIVGKICAVSSDCTSEICTNQICVQGPTCTDGTQNSDETGVDCGGTKCGLCPVTSAAYCKDMVSNCTADNSQYADEANCLKIAASFVQGAVGAMTGNSLECRAYHAYFAKAAMKPEVHCGHAGLTGGDLDPTATGPGKDGPCGDGVEAFCKLAVDTCKGQPGAYADVATCTAEAKTFKASTTPFGGTKDTTGDTFNCRAYHLTAATKDAASATTHCPHIKLASAACK